jgi:hypothetical protein
MMGFVKHSKPTSNWGGPPCPIFAQESLAALQQAGRCRSKQHGVWALLVKQFWLGLSRLLPGGMLSPGDNCFATVLFEDLRVVFSHDEKKHVFFYFCWAFNAILCSLNLRILAAWRQGLDLFLPTK